MECLSKELKSSTTPAFSSSVRKPCIGGTYQQGTSPAVQLSINLNSVRPVRRAGEARPFRGQTSKFNRDHRKESRWTYRRDQRKKTV